MNSGDIQRAVRAHRIDRATGDAPSLGHLGRMPGTGLPKGPRRSKRRDEREQGKRERNNRQTVIVVWSTTFALVATGVLAVAVWFWLYPKIHSAAAKGPAEVAGAQQRVASRFMSPAQQVAVERVKQAMSIREPDKVADFYHLGSASPEEVAGFLRHMEEVDGVITGYDWLSSMDANGLLLDGVLVKTLAKDHPRNRLALLTPNEQGTWKIDFEAFARTVRPSWSELMAANAGQGRVRVMVAKDIYYNGPFRDEARWICYGMASPDLEQVLLGYCRRDSAQAAAMERIVSNGKLQPGDMGLNRATVEIRRVAGAESRQFEITQVLAEDWVTSAKSFDTNFK